jgi:NADPH:quinone reductase
MRAVVITGETVAWREAPDPEPGPRDLLVRVRAAGVTPVDLMQVAGMYPAPPGTPQNIPGLEPAGEVVTAGSLCRRFGVGDRVMAVVDGAGQAELALIPEALALPVPDGISWAQAGGFPENYTTAYDALFTQCQLAMGERVCINGAGGGVGTAAVELAVAAGCDVVATVRNPDIRAGVATLGATVLAPDELVSAGPFDVILELVGAGNMGDNLKVLRTGGRISVIGIGGSGAHAQVDLLALMQARGRIHGSVLRARAREEKAMVAQRVDRHVVPLLAAGRLTVPIAATYLFADAAEAYERQRQGGKLGKIVLVAE